MIFTLIPICLLAGAYGASVEIDPFQKWRVVGGRDAYEGEVPYIVSLQRSNSHNCGGTIIHRNWVITACHCAQSGLTVVAGSNTLSPAGTSYAVGSYKCHESYGTNGYLYDIALLYIPSGINLVPGKVETLPLCCSELGSIQCYLFGWGRLSANGAIPNRLQALPLVSLTHAQCQNYWQSMVQTSNVCTLTIAGEGACYGDSGGPLVTAQGNKCLLGLVNWGNPCANGRPDVYAKISYFASWICTNTNANVCPC